MDLSFICYYLELHSTQVKTQKIGDQYHFWASLKKGIEFELVLSETFDKLVISAEKSGVKIVQTLTFDEKFYAIDFSLEGSGRTSLFKLLVCLMMNLGSVYVWGFVSLRECASWLQTCPFSFFKKEIERLTLAKGQPSKTSFIFEAEEGYATYGFKKISSDFAIGKFQPDGPNGEDEYFLNIPSEKYQNIWQEKTDLFLRLITWCWKDFNSENEVFAKWTTEKRFWGLPDEHTKLIQRMAVTMAVQDVEIYKAFEKGLPFSANCTMVVVNGEKVWRMGLKPEVSETKKEVEKEVDSEENSEKDSEEEAWDSEADFQKIGVYQVSAEKAKQPIFWKSDASEAEENEKSEESSDSDSESEPPSEPENKTSIKEFSKKVRALYGKIVEETPMAFRHGWLNHYDFCRKAKTLTERIIVTNSRGIRMLIVLFLEEYDFQTFKFFESFGFSVKTHTDLLYHEISW